jgi:glyoxylase-like metal-dependent hydrolase (beta-lactamase superfamily II)
MHAVTVGPPKIDSPAAGVARFTVPLDLPSPDRLNCHLIEGAEGMLLVDCGTVGAAATVRKVLEIVGDPSPAVLVTHGHIDHWGCATAFGPSVYAHPEVEMSLRFARDGAPNSSHLPVADLEAIEHAFGGFRELITGVPEIVALHDGQRLGEWEVLWTPGHDPGHVCLWRERDGILICGDLLLPGFTPNIQPAPGHRDTLAEFFDSLERVASLPVELVLPAHGEPFRDAASRAHELQRHHRERLARIWELINARPRAVDEIAGHLFGEVEDAGDRMLATMETVAHLRYLDERGYAVSTEGAWEAA